MAITGCSTARNLTQDSLYANGWELEYLNAELPFGELFPERKPTLFFEKKTGTVQGQNSCNGYSSSFRLRGDRISFSEPGPTTLMYCGEGENYFLRSMAVVDQLSFDPDGKLVLWSEGKTIMRFKPISG